MRYQEHVEYLTVYTAALEREFIRSQQRSAPAPKLKSTRGRVSQFLQKHSESWWTQGEIAVLLGETIERVNTAIWGLYRFGLVARKEPSFRGRRGDPQRYRWIGEQ